MIIDVGDTCAFGGITLGQTDSNGVEWYFTGIDGWEAVDATTQAIQRAQGDGGFATPAYLIERTFTVYGAILAPSRSQLVASKHALNAAASINAQSITVTSGGSPLFVLGQRTSAVTPKNETDISVEFAVTFLATSPVRSGALMSASSMLPASSGGLTVPFTVPFSINSTVSTGRCSLINPGNATGDVIARIDGPVVGPVITHDPSGLSLAFASTFAIGTGSWVDIDMQNETVLLNGQTSQAIFLTSAGFPRFTVGANTWALTAAAYSSTAKLTIYAYPAYL